MFLIFKGGVVLDIFCIEYLIDTVYFFLKKDLRLPWNSLDTPAGPQLYKC